MQKNIGFAYHFTLYFVTLQPQNSIILLQDGDNEEIIAGCSRHDDYFGRIGTAKEPTRRREDGSSRG